MIPVIQERIDKLSEICSRYKVRRLFIFGSAAEDRFDPAKSGLDFLVEFQSLSPSTHSDNYFGLLEDLERLFGLPVDLLEPDTIRNPFLRKKIEESQSVIYDQALLGTITLEILTWSLIP